MTQPEIPPRLVELIERRDVLWGQRERLRNIIHTNLLDEVHFPIAPFDGSQSVSDISGKTLAVGIFLFPEEEIQLVNSVDWAIFRNLCSPDMRKRREKVHDMDDLDVDVACRHLAGPSNDEWGAK